MNKRASPSPFRAPPEQRKRFYQAACATRRTRRLLGSLALVCLTVYLLAVA